jgi:alpha-galactosidase
MTMKSTVILTVALLCVLSPISFAMAAPTALAEFNGNVIAVQTAPFCDKKLGEIDAKIRQGKPLTPEEQALWPRGASNAGYHYLGCAKILSQMGNAFAEAILNLKK